MTIDSGMYGNCRRKEQNATTKPKAMNYLNRALEFAYSNQDVQIWHGAGSLGLGLGFGLLQHSRPLGKRLVVTRRKRVIWRSISTSQNYFSSLTGGEK